MNVSDYIMTMLFHKKSQAVLLFSIVIPLIFSCAQNKPAPQVHKAKKINLSQKTKIALIPWINKTKIHTQKDWPTETGEADELYAIFTDLVKTMRIEMTKYSQFNHVSVVHQSEFPHYRIQLLFHEASRKPDGWLIPIEVRVYNQTDSDEDFSFIINHKAIIGSGEMPKETKFYWSIVLKKYAISFPYPLIMKNLFSPDNN